MSNNYRNQQHNGNYSAENNEASRPGNLLRDYRQQQQQQERVYQRPPTAAPAAQGPPQASPVPPQREQGSLPYTTPLPQRQPPQPQGWPSSQREQQQGWVANTMQTVRGRSGRRPAIAPVDQHPLVLYRPTQPPALPKPKRWKRSRTVRIAMRMKHRRARWQKASPNAQKILSGVLIALCLFLVVFLSSGTAVAFGYYQNQLPRLQGLANQQISQTTHIYDRNGLLLYDLYENGGRRTPVAYKYIPQIMQDAMIAAEDHTFWTNSGIDPQGILRAATQFAQSNSIQSGGSTIAQQLIKNLTGNATVSINRKVPEAALAIGLTQQYPKWKILEMYFNVASYGSQDLGVEAAVEDYFHLKSNCDKSFNCTPAIYYLDVGAHGKHDPLLALARASLLAGMPQNPVSYDPTLGPDAKNLALQRQDEVLQQMLGLGMQVQGLGPITPDIIAQAETLTAKMTFARYQHLYHHGCQHFVQWVISQLSAQLGDALVTGGFNIRTTIDANLEAYVESAVDRHLNQPDLQLFPSPAHWATLSSPEYNVNDAAAVVMDAKTGEILAMDGSSDYNSKITTIRGEYNAATSPRQPGSAFKPIVYTTAFQQGWYPGIVLDDQKTYFPGSGTDIKHAYTPPDYGGPNVYHNLPSNIRLATANSFNVPAVKAIQSAGLDNVVNTARRFGITSIDQDLADYNAAHGTHLTIDQHFGLSTALGTIEVPLLQMVGAYQVFANQGMRIPPQSILDIWDNYGHHLYHYDQAHPHAIQVLSPQLAYIMTSVLSDENARQLEFWPDHDLSFWDWDPTHAARDVAAKTGTTDNFRDNWTIGYTPNVVVGVWAGNADNTPFGQNVVGITGAAPIWHSVIERVSGHCNIDIDSIPCGKFDANQYNFTQAKFVQPPGVIQQCVSTTNGLAGGGYCNDWMLDGEQPQQTGVYSGGINGTGHK